MEIFEQKKDPKLETKMNTLEIRNRMMYLLMEIRRKAQMGTEHNREDSEFLAVTLALYDDMRPKIVKYSERNKDKQKTWIAAMDFYSDHQKKFSLLLAKKSSARLNQLCEDLGITALEDISKNELKY